MIIVSFPIIHAILVISLGKYLCWGVWSVKSMIFGYDEHS